MHSYVVIREFNLAVDDVDDLTLAPFGLVSLIRLLMRCCLSRAGLSDDMHTGMLVMICTLAC